MSGCYPGPVARGNQDPFAAHALNGLDVDGLVSHRVAAGQIEVEID
jgi:hypothetical protein